MMAALLDSSGNPVEVGNRKQRAQEVVRQLESQCAALLQAHSGAKNQHRDFSLAYFLLRAKEPKLSRYVVAKRLLAGDAGAQGHVMADHQLLSLVNEASSSAFEIDSISNCRLSDLETCHRIWLVAQVRLPPH